MENLKLYSGEVFEGVISGVMEWGIFVELPNTVEGLVRITELRDDYYIFLQDSYQLVGENSGNTYKLGQKVKVCVEGVDKVMRTIDFSIVEE